MWPQTGPRTTPRRSRRPRPPERARRAWGLWIVAGVLAIVAAAVVAIVGSEAAGPKVGDHWHAPFKIVLCGERVPPLPASDGDVHTHGDDVIHIHPHAWGSAGRNATIGAFLRSAALNVTETSITIKSKTVENGDRCGDGRAGHVTVLINDRPAPDFAGYVPRDGDQIEFRFGP